LLVSFAANCLDVNQQIDGALDKFVFGVVNESIVKKNLNAAATIQSWIVEFSRMA
jgi:hypothetical protein